MENIKDLIEKRERIIDEINELSSKYFSNKLELERLGKDVDTRQATIDTYRKEYLDDQYEKGQIELSRIQSKEQDIKIKKDKIKDQIKTIEEGIKREEESISTASKFLRGSSDNNFDERLKNLEMYRKNKEEKEAEKAKEESEILILDNELLELKNEKELINIIQKEIREEKKEIREREKVNYEIDSLSSLDEVINIQRSNSMIKIKMDSLSAHLQTLNVKIKLMKKKEIEEIKALADILRKEVGNKNEQTRRENAAKREEERKNKVDVIKLEPLEDVFKRLRPINEIHIVDIMPMEKRATLTTIIEMSGTRRQKRKIYKILKGSSK